MQNEILTEHVFHLHTDSQVTAEALADSLLGLDGVIRRSGDILKVLLADGGRVRTEVLIKSIEVASYKENFLVRLLLGKGRAMEAKIEEIRRTLDLKEMSAKKLVAILIGALIVYVAWKAMQPSDPAKTHIENSFNTYAIELNISREQLIGLLDGTITNKADLRKNVVRLVHPSGDIRSGSLVLDGDERLSIPAEVIRAVPAHFEAEEADEPFADRDGCQITIRAVDLDRSEQGWAAIVPDVSERRLPLRISENLDPTKIPIGRYVHADITVIYKVDRYGNKSPKRYQLRKWRENLSLSGEP